VSAAVASSSSASSTTRPAAAKTHHKTRHSNASHSKLAGEPRHLLSDDYRRKSTLRPSTAYQMLLLADIQPGEIVCDCMCGVGTIPLEASAMFPGNVIYSFGGELDTESTSVAGKSVALSNRRAAAAGIRSDYFRKGNRILNNVPAPAGSTSSAPAPAPAPAPVATASVLPVDICGWDAQRLPLRDGSVDVFCIDMPFGVSCRLTKKAFRRILGEIARTLRDAPESRAVLLYQARKSFRKAIRDLKGKLHIESVRVVNIGGLLVGLYVVRKGPGGQGGAADHDGDDAGSSEPPSSKKSKLTE
jgi:23S rRNA G2445 N2-methylase RlmL